MEWFYEPKPFEVEDGVGYLPDFAIPSVMVVRSDGFELIDALYVEAKGRMDRRSFNKVKRFAEKHELLVVLDITKANVRHDGETGVDWWRRMKEVCREYPYPYSFRFIDASTFGAFLGVTWDGRPCIFSEADQYRQAAHHGAMDEAMKAAAFARFDHGQRPENDQHFINAQAMVKEAKQRRR